MQATRTAPHRTDREPPQWGLCRKVRLHPLCVRALGRDEHLVVRLDGKAAIRTRGAGADAVRLLSRNADLRRAMHILDARLGGEVDLSTLLDALLRGGLVKEVDGRSWTAARITAVGALRCYWTLKIDPLARVPRLLFRLLPPRLSLRLAYPMRKAAVQRSGQVAFTARVRDRLPVQDGGDSEASLRERHLEAIVRQDVLARMLCDTPPRELDRWLCERVSFTGLSHFEEAKKDGRGVVLACLHHGPFPLIPVKLLSLGIALHGFHWLVDFAGRDFNELFRPHGRLRGWAEGRFYGLPSWKTLPTFVRAVCDGGTAIVMPDFYQAGPTPSGDRDRAFHGTVRVNAVRSAVPVPVGRKILLAHGWTGWLAGRAGAATIPVRCAEVGAGEYRVELLPAVPPPPHGDPAAGDEVTRSVLAALVPDLVRHPTAWTFLMAHPAFADAHPLQ